MSAQLSHALQKLASFRAQNSRQSLDIVATGAPVLHSLVSRAGSGADADACAALEQLALAAVDVGRLELADVGTKLLIMGRMLMHGRI